MQRIPSTQALRALEAFARLGSIWLAAEELHLTKSAVSHQLRQLERELGFPLTARSGTRLNLTPLGADYARDIRRALDILASSAAQSATRGVSGTLVVSCPPGFASNWLCTVIESFQLAFPEVGLRIVTPRRLNDVSTPEVDLFIAFGETFIGNADIELLKPIAYTPLCSPAYLNRFGRFPDAESLKGATLLHLGDTTEWREWMRLIGLPEALAQGGIRFSDMNLVYSAALAGQGIAMGDEFVCGEALDRGQLVRPFAKELPTKNAYCLATPRDKAPNPVRAAFLTWLREALRNR
jgi:LysR family transcriptional regulator, glycine cleavage system transcriptional activator